MDARETCNTLGTFFGLSGYVFDDVVAAYRQPRVPSFVEEAVRLLGR
jgi:hypothetical protein